MSSPLWDMSQENTAYNIDFDVSRQSKSTNFFCSDSENSIELAMICRDIINTGNDILYEENNFENIINNDVSYNDTGTCDVAQKIRNLKDDIEKYLRRKEKNILSKEDENKLIVMQLELSKLRQGSCMDISDNDSVYKTDTENSSDINDKLCQSESETSFIDKFFRQKDTYRSLAEQIIVEKEKKLFRKLIDDLKNGKHEEITASDTNVSKKFRC